MSSPLPKVDIEKALHAKLGNHYVPKTLVWLLRKIVHEDRLNEILAPIRNTLNFEFMDGMIRELDISFDLHIEDESIWQQKRLLFASTHPLGGLDGIILASVIGRHYNENIKLIVNDILMNITNLQDIFVPVNKTGNQTQSRESMERIAELYNSDFGIVNFPSGKCARKEHGQITEQPWMHSFIIKCKRTGRDIVPIYFDGHNSSFFYNLALSRNRLHIPLNIEMLFLPHEMVRAEHSHYDIYIGKPIPYTTFDKSKTFQQWAEWLRQETLKLKPNASANLG